MDYLILWAGKQSDVWHGWSAVAYDLERCRELVKALTISDPIHKYRIVRLVDIEA